MQWVELPTEDSEQVNEVGVACWETCVVVEQGEVGFSLVLGRGDKKEKYTMVTMLHRTNVTLQTNVAC